MFGMSYLRITLPFSRFAKHIYLLVIVRIAFNPELSSMGRSSIQLDTDLSTLRLDGLLRPAASTTRLIHSLKDKNFHYVKLCAIYVEHPINIHLDMSDLCLKSNCFMLVLIAIHPTYCIPITWKQTKTNNYVELIFIRMNSKKLND